MIKRLSTIYTYCWQHGIIALLLVAVTITPVALTTGCSTAQVITDIEKFSPVVLNVLTLACLFTPASPLCATGAAAINTLISQLVSLLTSYNAHVKAGTATVAEWNYLNAMFGTFEEKSNEVFNLLHISSGGTQKEALAVEAAGQILLAGIEALFPAAPAPVAAAHARSAKFAANAPANVVYDAHWLSSWEKDYNTKVDAAKKANPQAGLKHVHSTLMTRMTLGRIK